MRCWEISMKMTSSSFGHSNHGLQIAVNHGPINAQPHASDGTVSKVDECRHHLLLTDPIFDHDTIKGIKGERSPGTCEWIRDNKSYISWLDGDSQRLWISGGPGKGKTMLSIFLIEELEGRTQGLENAQLMFYICDHQDEKRNSAVTILRSFVYQLLTKRRELFERISSYFEDPKKTQAVLSSPQLLWEILKTLLQAQTSRIYCVLDGLDECDEDSIRFLTDRLQTYFSEAKPDNHIADFKLVVLSRKILGLTAFLRVRLDPDNNENTSSDIQRFITDRINHLEEIPGFQAIRNQVKATLLERAHGTFLWVSFVTEELLKKTTCLEILETLNGLPSGLPAIYSRMLNRTDKRRRPILSKILTWVTMSVRPLTLMELATAIDIRPTNRLSVEQVTIDHIALCGNILIVNNQRVSLVHQSAGDYLLQSNFEEMSMIKEFRITERIAHSTMANKCIEFLEESDLRYGPLTSRELSHRSILSPLLRYAVLHWSEHAKAASSNQPGVGLKFDQPFFKEDSAVRRHWWLTYHYVLVEYDFDSNFPDSGPGGSYVVEFEGRDSSPSLSEDVDNTIIFEGDFEPNIDYDPLTLNPCPTESSNSSLSFVDDNQYPESDIPSLHLACYLGIEPWARQMLSKNIWKFSPRKADDLVHLGKSPLAHATSNGHESIVRLLIEKGAPVGSDEEALNCAAMNGHEAIVRILLEKGASLSGAALASAAREGHESIVELLLELGPGEDEWGFSKALWEAAWEGHERVVKLLVEWHSHPKIHDLGYSKSTILERAATRGHTTIVKLVLDHYSNIPHSSLFAALQSAIMFRYQTITMLISVYIAAVRYTSIGS